MNQTFSRLWREPLLHFLLIGAILFVLYDYRRGGEETAPNQIVVSAGQIEQLIGNFERTWSRKPTAEERDQLIEGFVRDEVFYREALAMGLDQDDPLVRRRMRMKLEFILEDLTLQDAEDSVLNDYLQQHSERYQREPTLWFQQVYLDPERHTALEATAKQLLESLANGAEPTNLGDATLARRAYENATQSEIARDFGEAFASEVSGQPLQQWVGPLYSPFGAHLVRVDQRIDARLPELAEIRVTVLRDYLRDQRELQKNLVYERLREGYDVAVEPATTGQ